MRNRPLNKDSGKEIDQAGNGGCAGRRDTSKRDKLRNRAGKGGRQKGRERTPAQGSPSLHFSELPRGSGGKLKMKHLIPGSRDVTLRVRGLGRLPRGNGEGARTGGAECKLPLPPHPSQEKACRPAHSSRGVPVPPCGTGQTGKLLARGWWWGSSHRGLWTPGVSRCQREPLY